MGTNLLRTVGAVAGIAAAMLGPAGVRHLAAPAEPAAQGSSAESAPGRPAALQAAPAHETPAEKPKPAEKPAQPAVGAPAATVAGDWAGAIDAGGAKVRLIVHVARAEDGALKATFDSPDQGAMGVPFDKAAFDGETLRLDIASIGARYEGKLAGEGTTLSGTWSQSGVSVPLHLARSMTKEGAGDGGAPTGKDAAAVDAPAAPDARPAPSDPIRDTWLGTIDAGGTRLRIAVHLSRGPDGVLSGTVDSLDQGAMGLPVTTALFKDGTLVLELKMLMASYRGTMNKDGTEINGQWTQGGGSVPLVLSPVEKVPGMSRPQEPTRPLPYREEEVVYMNASAGVKLAGTITIPESGGPFPAALLITGSGPEDRNETVFGHRPFLILSDDLTRHGIAVLRVDDRGVGGSSLGPEGATTADFAGDVLAGVAYLKARKEIDPARIGLIGHSEGGLIAPLAALSSKDVAFVVLLAAPGLPGEEIVIAQNALIMKAAGSSPEEIERARSINTRLYAIVKEEKDRAAAEKRLREVLASAAPELASQTVDVQVKVLISPWFRHFLTYDPRPTLAQIKAPVLAINGERDLQVPAKENIAAIRAALDSAGHKDHTVVILPGLNHLFQPCTTGSPSEYALIEQTFSPDALKAISDWILARTRKV